MFARETLELLNHLSRADAGQGAAADVGGVKQIVALDAVGAAGFFQPRDRAERDHFAAAVARLELRDRVGIDAELRFGLGVNLPGAAKQIEVVHVNRAEIGLQRLADIGHADAHAFGFLAIDLHTVLRDVRSIARDDRREFRVALGGVEQRARRAIQRRETGIVQVLHLQLETAGISQTAQRRRRKNDHTPFLHDRKLFADFGEHLFAPAAGWTFVEWVEDKERGADVRLIGLQHRRVAGNRKRVRHARNLARNSIDLPDRRVRALE